MPPKKKTEPSPHDVWVEAVKAKAAAAERVDALLDQYTSAQVELNRADDAVKVAYGALLESVLG